MSDRVRVSACPAARPKTPLNAGVVPPRALSQSATDVVIPRINGRNREGMRMVSYWHPFRCLVRSHTVCGIIMQLQGVTAHPPCLPLVPLPQAHSLPRFQPLIDATFSWLYDNPPLLQAPFKRKPSLTLQGRTSTTLRLFTWARAAFPFSTSST
jgi:hypothetical protein